MKGPQILYQTGALGPGAKLWVIPDESTAEWSKKLDWYLNFQISKAKDHQMKALAPEFEEQLQDYEIEVGSSEPPPELLMISCNNLLPSEMLVIIPAKEDPQLWLEKIHSVWLNLLKPSLRIFLPDNFPTNDFIQVWPDKTFSSDITLVPSQKSAQG